MLYVICSQFKGEAGFDRTKCLVRAFVKPSRFWHLIATVDGVVASRLKQQRRMVDQPIRQGPGSSMTPVRRPLSGRSMMKNNLEVRRKKLLHEIERVDREMALTQKSMVRIESQIAAIQQPRVKAA